MQEKQEKQASKARERAEPQIDMFDRDRVRNALAAFRATVREDADRPAERSAKPTEAQRMAQFD